MNIRNFYEYDSVTGLFTGRRYSYADRDDLDAQLAARARGKEMLFESNAAIDTLSARIVDGAVADYKPPSPEPAEAFQWDELTKRWQMVPARRDRKYAAERALTDLQRLDAKQLRALTEVVINPESATARERFLQIENEKEALRGVIRSAT